MAGNGFRKTISTKEAAQICGVSPQFLLRRRRDGDGPQFYKLGKKVIYALEDVERWFDRHRRGN